MIEWLEKCIEIADYYPDWKQRKQIHNTNIKRQDFDCLGKAEKALSNKLAVFVRSIGDNVPSFLHEGLKEKLYQLAFFLLGVHEILEGKDAKIEQDSENKKRRLDPETYEYNRELNRVFAHINIENHFEGDANRGKAAFERIVKNISVD
ncbi:5484_t:CDS:2, partial [Dentiscutata heterogama]